MKHIQKFEDIKIVNSSDLGDSWSPRDLLDKNQKPHIEIDIDSKRASNVEALLEYYDIKMSISGKRNYLTERDLLFNSEKDYVEYRVILNKILTLDDYIENETNCTMQEFEESDDYTDEEKEEIIKGYDNIEYKDDDVQFSVFIPVNITNLHQKNQLALIQATNYLIMLNEHIPETFKGIDYMEAISDYGKEFGKILTKKEIEITNQNLDIASKMSYRIYKDSKFFSALKDVIGGRTMEKLIQDWIKL